MTTGKALLLRIVEMLTKTCRCVNLVERDGGYDDDRNHHRAREQPRQDGIFGQRPR